MTSLPSLVLELSSYEFRSVLTTRNRNWGPTYGGRSSVRHPEPLLLLPLFGKPSTRHRCLRFGVRVHTESPNFGLSVHHPWVYGGLEIWGDRSTNDLQLGENVLTSPELRSCETWSERGAAGGGRWCHRRGRRGRHVPSLGSQELKLGGEWGSRLGSGVRRLNWRFGEVGDVRETEVGVWTRVGVVETGPEDDTGGLAERTKALPPGGERGRTGSLARKVGAWRSTVKGRTLEASKGSKRSV